MHNAIPADQAKTCVEVAAVGHAREWHARKGQGVAREWVQHVLRAVRRANDTLFVTTKDLFSRAKCHTANSLLDAAGQLMSHNKTLVAYCMHKKQFVWHSVTARVTQQEVDVTTKKAHAKMCRYAARHTAQATSILHDAQPIHYAQGGTASMCQRAPVLEDNSDIQGTQPCPHTCR
jgi:hypothetical protein